jgi:alkylation response protein AidB-like acyl-CoA dehydrogenase
MDFGDSPEEASFREEVRTWFAAHLPAGWANRRPQAGRYSDDEARRWSRALYDAGYVGLTWPKAFGGRGLGHAMQGIFLEESARVGAPEHIGVIGLGMAGPTIIAHGTDEQKARYLGPLLKADEIWCQGFSEPGSGSDLAAVRTRAVLDGDEWVINGQKVWSSYAHIADHCILLVRTDPAADRHRGLSYLLVDMKTAGVEVRPLTQITGDPEFNEIFFDDVRIPRCSMLGEVGDGWEIAMTTLLHERGTLGFGIVATLEQRINQLIVLVGESGMHTDPLVRDQVAQFWIALQALRFTNYRSITALQRTGVPGPEGSITKLFYSEVNQALTSFAQRLCGLFSQLDDEAAVWGGFWTYQQLRSRANTIEAGTSEVLRNIIAERVMGLPSSR